MKVTKSNILVEEVKISEKVSKGGIIIPSTVSKEEKTKIVSVVQVGDNVSDIEIGNNLIVNQYSGISVEINNKNYLIITEADVLIIL